MHKQKIHEFSAYYDLYKDKIFTFFMYRVAFNQTVAEDLTAETFLKAWRAFADFEQRSFQAWIYRIAKNHLVNYYRVLDRELALDEAEDHDKLINNDLVADLDARLHWEQVRAAMDKLPLLYREVLLLRYADELDNEEIADFLELSAGAARTRLSRAKKELLKILDYKEQDE